MLIDLKLMEFRKELTKEWPVLQDDCDAWDDFRENCFDNIVVAPMRAELPKVLSGQVYASYDTNANTGILVKVENGRVGLIGKKDNENVYEWSDYTAKSEMIFTLIEFAHPSSESNFEHVIGRTPESNQLFCFPVSRCCFYVAT